MDNKKVILVNYIQQKFVKIANIARIKEEDGKNNDYEFICLKKLHALLVFLSDHDDPTYDQMVQAELLANKICGRTFFPYRPMDWKFIDFEAVQPGGEVEAPLGACDITYTHSSNLADYETVCSYLDYIMDNLTYEHPWIRFAVLNGYEPGKYEVGSPNLITELSVRVNKLALVKYFITFEEELTEYARELKDNLPNQFIGLNFQVGEPTVFTLEGEYRDLQRYKGQNIRAFSQLKWETAWPCYYGTGPVDAMDDPATRNAFMQSLTRSFECPSCIDVNIPEGHVFWYFYPFANPKLFKTENGVITGSFKGTFPARTKSMDDFNVAGSYSYGVIRTAEEGIRCTELCIIDVTLCEIETPEDPVYVDPVDPADPVDPPPVDTIEFDSIWTDQICVLELQFLDPDQSFDYLFDFPLQ